MPPSPFVPIMLPSLISNCQWPSLSRFFNPFPQYYIILVTPYPILQFRLRSLEFLSCFAAANRFTLLWHVRFNFIASLSYT
ncbi:hypothetical protein LXL04_012972 [Taraxacum kok-saghyz]